MHDFLLDLLICPACHAELVWQINKRNQDGIKAANAYCVSCNSQYTIVDGIANFLCGTEQQEDLWEQSESGLARFLLENPQAEKRLMDSPLNTLNPADQFFRALLLEEHGLYLQARQMEEHAQRDMYTQNYLEGIQNQIEFIKEQLRECHQPIFDLASGRCYLVEELLNVHKMPIIVSDLSPRVLHRDLAYFRALGLDAHLSFLACDARQMPLKNGSIQIMTSNLGLLNIRQPTFVLAELRRVVAGKFLALTHFYDPYDATNASTLQELGLEQLAFEHAALASFRQAGWQVTIANPFRSLAKPTPVSEIIHGAMIDSLPVCETELTWCTLIAE